ncbi:uncharacterized protein EV420DRAFT_1481550 [Desarmillaria tabescens]|uniref:RING-type domain-containing protein n=1 Tax=Armillaria tabescens TaxID=1929756 RepID=A0AA39N2U2_ARMTA|nr:uncharacterized protein EV420DRAFT_1481550 [Desarmillaria tabescens]KAK0455314.1 hypothetical protein EV420DRAFT_1481550 [Desarmillaria tabescens]
MVELDVVSADNWELHGARIVVPTLGSAVKRLLIHAIETFPPVPMFIDLLNLVSLEWFAFMSGEISPTFRRKIHMCIAYHALPANRDVVNTSSLVNVSYGTYAEVWDYIGYVYMSVPCPTGTTLPKNAHPSKLAPWGFVETRTHQQDLPNKMLGYDEFEKSLYRETLICAIVHSEASWVQHMRFSDGSSNPGLGGETKERVTSRVWVKVELDVEESVEDYSFSMEDPISRSVAPQETIIVGVKPGDPLSDRIHVLDQMRGELADLAHAEVQLKKMQAERDVARARVVQLEAWVDHLEEAASHHEAAVTSLTNRLITAIQARDVAEARVREVDREALSYREPPSSVANGALTTRNSRQDDDNDMGPLAHHEVKESVFFTVVSLTFVFSKGMAALASAVKCTICRTQMWAAVISPNHRLTDCGHIACVACVQKAFVDQMLNRPRVDTFLCRGDPPTEFTCPTCRVAVTQHPALQPIVGAVATALTSIHAPSAGYGSFTMNENVLAEFFPDDFQMFVA